MEKPTLKPARSDLLLPASVDGFKNAQLLVTWYEQLWSSPNIDAQDENGFMLLSYLSMLFDTGLPHLAALDSVLALRSTDGRSFNVVTILAQRLDNEYGETRLHLSKRTRLAVYCWKSRWPDSAYRLIRKNTKERTQAIKKMLEGTFNKWRRSATIARISFYSLCRLSRFVAMKRGLDPFLISIYAGSTRVTDQAPDDVYLLTGSAHSVRDQQIVRFRTERAKAEAPIETEIVGSETRRFSSHHWCHRAKSLLRSMCDEIRTRVPQRLQDSQKNTLVEVIAHFRNEALSFSGGDSALVMAIDYASYIFVEERSVSSGSLRNYLDRCVINGLLNNPESESLEYWDPDDYFDNYEERISSVQLKNRSRTNIAQAYLSVFKFLGEKKNVAGLPKRSFGPAQGNAAGQWRLLAPPAVDELLVSLFETGKFLDEQVGLSIGLGYYAGLRASEVKNLTCGSVVFAEGLPNLDIEILSGKSRSARRRLPLDTLAPPRFQKCLEDYAMRRFRSVDVRLHGRVALFGPCDSADRYTYDSLIRLVRTVLQDSFGQGVNFHTLRHCFCSLLFLRWFALRNPEVVRELRSGNHQLFQRDLQGRLQRYFSINEIDDGDIRPYDLISMIKLTGHSSPEVLFNYYVHSAFLVQKHSVDLMDRMCPPSCPPNRALTVLVPRMRSHASRERLRKRWSSEESPWT